MVDVENDRHHAFLTTTEEFEGKIQDRNGK